MTKNLTHRRPKNRDAAASKLAAKRLLESVVAIGNGPSNLAERRRAVLSVLTELLEADAGQWGWGRGTPNARTVVPVAMIDVGLSHAQRASIVAWANGPDADRSFHERVQARRANHDWVTSRRQDIFPNAEWQTRPLMRQHLERAGFDCWLHSIRYSPAKTWSMFAIYRKIGRAPFSSWHAELADLAMSSISWLHSADEQTPPPETLIGLKPRQRQVMLMLLDGLPRKSIAEQLKITEHTVGDHIKAIYNHFRVGSATQLAALFLRGS